MHKNISVAMTTYNGEKYIEKQIKSILLQSKKVDEIIIYDDCSTDKTVEIIKNIMKTSEVDIRLYINKENQGYLRNFRNAINATQGDYIFLSDQDDLWNLDKVEKIMGVFESENIGVLCTQYQMIDENDLKLREEDFVFNGSKKIGKKRIVKISLGKLLYGNIVPGCTYCFTKEVKKLYLREIKKPIIHDYSIALIGAILNKAYYLNEKTISYRIHSNNSIGIKKKKDKVKITVQKNRKPYVLEFLENYYDIMSFSQKLLASVVLYFRLPLLKTIVKKYLK